MLTNKKNIDQLFQEKLGDYEKNPSTSGRISVGTLTSNVKIKRLGLVQARRGGCRSGNGFFGRA